MFVKKRRKLPNSKKKIHWYVLVFPILILMIGASMLFRMRANSAHFISALPEKKVADNTESNATKTIQTAFEHAGFTVDTIETSSDSAYLVHLQTGETIIVNISTPVSHISSLQSLVSNLTMEGKRIDRLDMRFDKPVVLFKK